MLFLLYESTKRLKMLPFPSKNNIKLNILAKMSSYFGSQAHCRVTNSSAHQNNGPNADESCY